MGLQIQKNQNTEDWHDYEEGELSVDVIDTGRDIIIISTVSGVDPDQVEVYVDGDTVTIRGKRSHPYSGDERSTYYHLECFWGDFSRTIVLPVHVRGSDASASYDRGVLEIRIPKDHEGFSVPIKIIDE